MSQNLTALKSRLLELVNKHAVVHGDFVLTSGARSTYYIDGKLLSLMPEGLNVLSRVILEMTKDDSVDAVGGLTLGADPIIGAVAALSHDVGTTAGRTDRTQRKIIARSRETDRRTSQAGDEGRGHRGRRHYRFVIIQSHRSA